MHPSRLLAGALLGSATALAVPMELTHQGRLFDSSGTPLEGPHDLTFTLSDAPTGGTTVWSETTTAHLDAGFYQAALGAQTAHPLDLELFDADELYLSVALDGGADIGERQLLRSAPYALQAGSATSVAGGSVDATEILVNGTTVIGSDGTLPWSALSGVPDGLHATLGGLAGCVGGQVATYDGSTWICGHASSNALHADDITDGVLAIERLPVGSANNQVAAGDHTHDAATLTGTIGANQVAFSAADIGGLSADGGDITGDLTVDGTLTTSGGIVSQAGQIHRDFATFTTTANSDTPIHIKTNLPIQTNRMYRFVVEGYNYGLGRPINSETVGYTYSQWECVGRDSHLNHSSGTTISTYCSTDGYVVVKLEAASFYYAGFGVSAWFTNQAGKAFEIEALDILQQVDDL